MKLGKIWKRGKRKYRYAYIKKEVGGRLRTVRTLLVLHYGAWVAVEAGKAFLTYKDHRAYGWK